MDKPKKQSPQAKKSTCHKLKKTAFKSTTDIINYSADFSSINWLFIANFLCPHDHFLLFPWFIAKTWYIDDKSSIFFYWFSQNIGWSIFQSPVLLQASPTPNISTINRYFIWHFCPYICPSQYLQWKTCHEGNWSFGPSHWNETFFSATHA